MTTSTPARQTVAPRAAHARARPGVVPSDSESRPHHLMLRSRAFAAKRRLCDAPQSEGYSRTSWTRKLFRLREGVRAAWQKWQKTLQGLYRTAASVLGSWRWLIPERERPDLDALARLGV